MFTHTHTNESKNKKSQKKQNTDQSCFFFYISDVSEMIFWYDNQKQPLEAENA